VLAFSCTSSGAPPIKIDGNPFQKYFEILKVQQLFFLGHPLNGYYAVLSLFQEKSSVDLDSL
jgi:hypothetical protein